MKKLLVIGILAMSASAFAFGGEHHYTEVRTQDGMRTICTVRTSHKMNGRHREMMKNMPKEMRNSLDKTRIEIKQRRLNIEKLLLEEPVNWNKIEEENTQIGILQGKMKTQIQKYMMTERPVEQEKIQPKPMKPIHHPVSDRKI